MNHLPFLGRKEANITLQWCVFSGSGTHFSWNVTGTLQWLQNRQGAMFCPLVDLVVPCHSSKCFLRSHFLAVLSLSCRNLCVLALSPNFSPFHLPYSLPHALIVQVSHSPFQEHTGSLSNLVPSRCIVLQLPPSHRTGSVLLQLWQEGLLLLLTLKFSLSGKGALDFIKSCSPCWSISCSTPKSELECHKLRELEGGLGP